MATINFVPVSMRRRPEFSSGNEKTFRSSLILKKRLVKVAAASSLESSPPPKAGSDGKYPVDRVKAISGEKLLRNIMSENKLELYAAYGKVMNCGGGGSCGTCIVEILDGKDLLNEKTNTELRYLKKKAESWRLACQTIVGNKENSGKVVVQRLPQWKK
eukprot:XP_015573156.1 photosynthetic NDH subunit of subcomplex B 3, chloroplastic isoform X2 [Ricinus communis]